MTLATATVGALSCDSRRSTATPDALPQFTSAARLKTARRDFAVALLDDGRVLIAGGLTADLDRLGVVLSSAELFDPSSGTIRNVSCPLQHARMRAYAAALPDGRAIIIGGDSLNQVTISQTEIYDPATDCFQPGPRLTDGSRTVQSALRLKNGGILVIEGFGASATGGAEILAAGANTFVGLDRDLGRATDMVVAALLQDGRVLLTGGMELTPSGLVVPTTRAEIFEPDSNRFRDVGSLTQPREAHAASPLGDGGALIVGGSAAGPYSSAEVFDPQREIFQELPSHMSVARVVPTAVPLANGDVLIVGGKPNFGMTPYLLAERFSLGCACFSSAAQSTMPLGLGHRTFIDRSGRIIIVRASNDPPSDTVAEIETFDSHLLH